MPTPPLNNRDRRILHVDMNAFYASVELLKFPELRDKPVAVGGSEDRRHGIVLAKNEVAKGFGIKTAETLQQARAKCPDLIVLPPHHDEYGVYSRKAKAYYRTVTERCESFGLDEAWLDVTENVRRGEGSAADIAKTIMRDIRIKFGLTVSIGVSWNKIFAKLGSDYKKPAAITVISPDNYRELLWPLPVGRMLFVGKVTEAKLNRLNIDTIGDLANCDAHRLSSWIGTRIYDLKAWANGEDTDPVLTEAEHGPPKSIGNSSTFAKDLTLFEEVERELENLSAKVFARMEKADISARGVQITVRDNQFRDKTRQMRCPPIRDEESLVTFAKQLFRENFRLDTPIRLLGVSVHDLIFPTDQRQLSFDDWRKIAAGTTPRTATDPNRQKLDALRDAINRKHGKPIVAIGFDELDKEKAQTEREDFT